MSIDLTALNLRSADSLTSTAPEGRKDLGQDEFMQLLLAQLNNQDPLNPLDNEAFVAQLAQFSTVSGITEISSGIKSLNTLFSANSAAAQAQWVGRTVSTDTIPAATVTAVQTAETGPAILMLDTGAMIAADTVKTIS